MNDFWNGKVKALIGFSALLCNVLFNKLKNMLTSLIHKPNFAFVGSHTQLYSNLTYRYPKQIFIGENCIINKNVSFQSEFKNSSLKICNNVHIGQNVKLDFTGDIIIGNNVTISENVSIFTHDHGFDPRSIPSRKSLTIADNVWIGSHAIILQNVEKIGNSAIVAAGSVVTKSVDSHTIVGGNPAKIIKILSRI